MSNSLERATTPVTHTDPSVSTALQRYAERYRDDVSVLVRPTQAYDGLNRVVTLLSRGAGADVLVTDLAGNDSFHRGSHAENPPTDIPHSENPQPDLASVHPGPMTWDGPLLAFHTSGSTGSPSCVVYRKETARAHARAIAASLNFDNPNSPDREAAYVALPPPRFAYGMSIVNSHLEAQLPVTFTDVNWQLPGLAEVAASTDQDLAVYALPQHTPLLLSADIDPQRLVRIYIAGGRITANSVARLAEQFPRMELVNMYGQAERGPRLSLWRGAPADFAEGTIGRPLPGVTLRVEPVEAGDDVGVTPGRVVAATPYSMSAHITAPYTAVSAGPGPAEVITTDLATVASDGTLRHAGRADHVLNVAGTKVDLRRVQHIVTEAASPLVVKVDSKVGTVSGDSRPVIEIVPGPQSPTRTGPIRRALDAEFGRLAGLFEIKFVRELTLKESGK